MGDLTREQRYDKNGRLNTKLVRTNKGPGSNTSRIPAPTLVDKKEYPFLRPAQDKFIKNLTKERKHRVKPDEWTGDEKLKELCASKLKMNMFNRPASYECTDGEIYDVYSTVESKDIAPLLAAGVRSAEEAQTFLKDAGMEHLIVDRLNRATFMMNDITEIDSLIEMEIDPDYVPGVAGYTPLPSAVPYGSSAGIALSPIIPYRSRY